MAEQSDKNSKLLQWIVFLGLYCWTVLLGPFPFWGHAAAA